MKGSGGGLGEGGAVCMYAHKSWDFNGGNYLVKSPGRSRANSGVWRELWEFSSPFSGEGQAGVKGPARDLLDFQSSCSSSDTQMSQISFIISSPTSSKQSTPHHLHNIGPEK